MEQCKKESIDKWAYFYKTIEKEIAEKSHKNITKPRKRCKNYVHFVNFLSGEFVFLVSLAKKQREEK